MAKKKLRPYTFENAKIIWKNFSGKPGQYNAEGQRNFALVLPPEIVPQMAEEGYNIKELAPLEEGDEPTYIVKVKVKFGNYPPDVFIIRENIGTATKLDENTVGSLDWAHITNVDLKITPWAGEMHGKPFVAVYLKQLYATIQEDALEAKYAAYHDDIRHDSAQECVGPHCPVQDLPHVTEELKDDDMPF